MDFMSPQPPHDHFLKLDPALIVASSAHCHAAFDPKESIKPGHLVVFPKAYREGFTGLEAEEASDLFALAHRVASAALPLVGAEKYYLLAVGDAVKHFHLHLLPKKPGEAGLGPFAMGEAGWRGQVGKPLSEQDVSGFPVLLKQALEAGQ